MANPESPFLSQTVNDKTFTKENSDINIKETNLDSVIEHNCAVQKYEDEWTELFIKNDIEKLRTLSQTGCLRASRFRSVCWRVLLEVLPYQINDWLTYLRNARCHYKKLKAQMTSDPRKQSRTEDDPLSQNTQSVWYQHFCDEELRAVIRQDVVRTFPGIDFFRKAQIQETMVDILFIYARVHPLMCYRQGMHEILAPLLFVLHCDHQAMLHTKEQGIMNTLIEEILDPDSLEEDGYGLFSKIMNGIEFCYNIKDLEPTPTGYFPTNASQSPLASESRGGHENEVVTRLIWIRDNLLSTADPEICDHLKHLDIPLPIFGIRWLRLLFGREFPLQDLLVLWDAIFAEGKYFEFVNFIVVAMLIAIRDQLLNSDYTTCLTFLMRYPGVVDITQVIDHALYLKNPQEHDPPLGVPSRIPNRKDVQGLKRNNQENVIKANQTQKKMDRRLHKIQSQNNIKYSTLPRGHTNAESVIVDGFRLSDPEILRVELNHAHNVMSLCQLKLSQYHKILQRIVPESNHIQETQLVLDGMYELCHLLRSRHYQHYNQEVEPALEAGEQRLSPAQSIGTTSVNSMNRNISQSARNLKFDNNHAVPNDEPLKLFSQIVGANGSVISGAPLSDPLSKLKVLNDSWDFVSDEFLTKAVIVLNTDLSKCKRVDQK